MPQAALFGVACLLAAAFMGTPNAPAAEKFDTDPRHPLARADGQPADMKKPVKVLILAGQSNMQGWTSVDTFDSMATDPKTAPILQEMRGTDGKPRVCERVWISSIGCAGDDTTEQKGKLTVGFGATGDRIGPEYPFGIYLEKIAGFVWFQGFNDLVSTWTYPDHEQPGGYDLYSVLLEHFIRDVRKDLNAPQMPFVIGVMGLNGMTPPQGELYFHPTPGAPIKHLAINRDRKNNENINHERHQDGWYSTLDPGSSSGRRALRGGRFARAGAKAVLDESRWLSGGEL